MRHQEFSGKMPPGPSLDIDELRQRVAAVAPELADAPFEVLSGGWDSVALDIGDRWIFKFPRTPALIASARREFAVLNLVRPRASLPVPSLRLYEDSAGLFSRHEKIPGRALLPEEYPALDEGQRAALADKLARFHADVHTIPIADARAAGARDVFPLRPFEQMRTALDASPRTRVLLETVDRVAALPEDRTIFGQFDGHGWNMAFDHARGVLNGLYDFGDAGIGTLHRDLGYSAWLDPELCRMVVRRYREITGHPADPEAAVLSNWALRLSEFADGTMAQVTDDAAAALLEHWRQVNS